METDPKGIAATVDTGADTFSRYVYQAEIAFRFCLDCALGGDIVSVVPEHLEDIALECRSSWRFLQIKTRNAELGPWKLSDLTAANGGLRSLLRTFDLVRTMLRKPTLELYLEGAVHSTNEIQSLITEEGRREKGAIRSVAKPLNLDPQACGEFLDCVRLTHSLPGRSTITACNLRLLGGHAPAITINALEQIYDEVIQLVTTAMRAALLDRDWIVNTLSTKSPSAAAQQRFLKKQITRSHLGAITDAIRSQPLPLLKHAIGAEAQRLTALEEKLILGGATPQLIEVAKGLRANAASYEIENSASKIFDDQDVLEDIRSRLLVRVAGLSAEHAGGTNPAASIWNKLVRLLADQRSVIDSRGIFRQDPDLLLGEICQLSDLCQTGWGTADA